jgi:hypothetical protein
MPDWIVTDGTIIPSIDPTDDEDEDLTEAIPGYFRPTDSIPSRSKQ